MLSSSAPQRSRLLTVVLLAATIPAGSLPAAAQGSADPCASIQSAPRRECGTITVLENPDGSGRSIPIRYLVVRAERPSEREPVFLFAGGPGQGSTDLLEIALGPLGSIGATRDLVMVDQRGTGGSNPLPCPRDLISAPALAFGHVFDPAFLASCRTRLEQRADLRFYTTERAIRDVDLVRAKLGYDKIMVWGGSYGTRIAQAYVRGYPDRVAAAVLDGVVPFDFRAPSSYAASLQQSLDRVFTDCAAFPACRQRYPDLQAAFERLVSKLSAGPLPATVRRPDSSSAAVTVSLGVFGYAVRGLLYSSRTARQLPELITQADRTGDLSRFAQAHWARAAALGGLVAEGLHFAIFCAEDIPFIQQDEIAALTRGSFIGRYLIDEYANGCREWVRAPIGPNAREPLRTSVPVLLISGWFDPVTPPEAAERVRAHLTNVHHLVVRNEGHGSEFGCARPAVLQFLETGSLAGLPAVCEGVTNLFEAPNR